MRQIFRYSFIPYLFGLWLIIGIFTPATAGDKLRIVTTTADLASIAAEVGGEQVEVFAIAKGYQDPHFVDAKPSYMIKLQKADLFIQVGLDLEIGWVPLLLDGARNSGILPGGNGFLDASAGVPLLQIPGGDPATLRAQGDIHASGNPHFWLDPRRGKQIAENIYRTLSRLQPENEARFKANRDNFNRRIDQKTTEWQQRLKPYAGTRIIAFHNSWPYFEEFTGLHIVDFIEPKPGIPPTPRHLVQVISRMQEQDVRIIIISPYYSKKSSELVASKTGARLIELATSVEAYPEIRTYFDLFEYNIAKMLDAFTAAGIQPAGQSE